MKVLTHILNGFVAAFLSAGLVFADTAELDLLLDKLAQSDLQDWEQVENSIWREWSSSGSPAMDLLLDRGRKAMDEGDFQTAITFLTALTDQAPEFAEGWNARATAFFNVDEYALSIADIQQALALNPRHFGALQGLGLMLEELENYDTALAAYRAAYAIHPHRDGLKEAIERLEPRVSGQDL